MGIEYIDKRKCKLVVYCGSDRNGKAIRRTKTVQYTSKRDAERKYREFESKVKNGETGNASLTVSKMCKEYYKHCEKKGLKETTLKGYRSAMNKIDKTIGRKQATKLTPYDIDVWIEEMNVSPKTIRNTLSFLSSAYRKAIRWQWVTTNPCTGAEIPSGTTKIRESLTLDQIEPFMQSFRECENQNIIVAIELALFCGLRRSEILGLTNENIILEQDVIQIKKARHRLTNHDIIDTPKTERSNRTLALPSPVKNDIIELIRQHDEFKDKYKIECSEYLILNDFLEPMRPAYLTGFIRDWIKEHNLPNVTLHGLRHTYASLVFHFGYDLTEVSAQLGHAQKSTTLNIYTHLIEDASKSSRDISNQISSFIEGESRVN